MSTVMVLSKAFFEQAMRLNDVDDNNVENKTETALISICSTTNTFCGIQQNHYFKQSKDNVLNIRFDDIQEEEQGLLLFNEDIATILIKFILKNIDKDFIVHCTAGISRSGAVGEFIRRLKGIEYSTFIRVNRQIQPNTTVLSILTDVYNKKFK